MERFQYGLIKASNRLAKEKGACELFERTKYADGILPIDTYERNVDEIVPHQLEMDWDSLRKEINKHGLRNSALSAIPPAASSSVVSNSTPGVDPVRKYLIAKMSKYGALKQLVPGFGKYEENYSLAWNIDNEEYLKFIAIFQKFLDQSISTNQYYDISKYKDNRVPIRELIRHDGIAAKYGLKTLYYMNVNDNSGNELSKMKKQENTEPKINFSKLEFEIDDFDSCEGGGCSV